MPVIQGNCANDKPIASIGLAPVLPKPTGVEPIAEVSSFSVTPLRALLDTGADGTSVVSSVAKAHQLRWTGLRSVAGVSGTFRHNTWLGHLGFFFDRDADFEGNGDVSQGLYVIDAPLLMVEIADNSWFDVIVGRDVLTQFDFFVRKGGAWELHLP